MQPVDTHSFSDRQRLAYDIIINHANIDSNKQSLLMIINGEGGTGKSYLISAIQSSLKGKCTITATTGKASYNVSGITIHSFLSLPVTSNSHKDLSGQALVNLQKKLTTVEYIFRQATGQNKQLFGGKSIILIGDPAQLPPVGDKPLCHPHPSNSVGEQGYFAYNMFNKVVVLTVNQRVRGSDGEQSRFRDLLSRLRYGSSNKDDWQLLLTRQPICATNLNQIKDVRRLFYSNKQVAKYNYTKLKELSHPVATIQARHSTHTARRITPHGLEPCLLLAKGSVVMLTMNLWASVGLCNGAKGTIVDIMYHPDQHPPALPRAVVVKFDNYTGPSLKNLPSCVPIPPVTASVNSVHERQHLPSKLAWALTIHKSQGLTLDKSWVDIGTKESTLGISYVAMSRSRNLSSMIIEPMTFEKLTSIKSAPNMKYRFAEEQRLLQLASNTAL